MSETRKLFEPKRTVRVRDTVKSQRSAEWSRDWRERWRKRSASRYHGNTLGNGARCYHRSSAQYWKYRRSTSPLSANGLFQFPVPTSETVFHHTWHLHRRLRHSDSVLRHFSFAFHIRTYGSHLTYTPYFILAIFFVI